MGELLKYFDVLQEEIKQQEIESEVGEEYGRVQALENVRGKFVSELKDDIWICDRAFLMDITTHLNGLDLKLQKQNRLIHEMYSHAEAFQAKLQIWENQLKTTDAFHFLTIINHRSKSGHDGFVVKLNELEEKN
ncbi:Hypothetical predicted protein [Octopus vulgaris]|uniref:Uncharacterized protein n=1 Tax=Octopus vulgaris TaxID=6645 RepID=A0AA36EZ44_OCTVU|nr:Hypothetical predicted protein [Octopus vulgaris]